jgi:hypothetical protein
MTDQIKPVTGDSEADQAAVLFGKVVKAVSEQAAVQVEGREVPLFFPRGIDHIHLSFVLGKVTITLNIAGMTCCKAAGTADDSSGEVSEAAREGEMLEVERNP